MMADKVIMTPGVVYGDLMALGTQLAGKGGTIVVTAIAPMTQTESSVSLFELAMWNKEIKGTIFGSLNPRADIPEIARSVPRWKAQARRVDHQPLQARRHQRGVPGDARR